MLDHNLLKNARQAIRELPLRKQAFNAMTPEAQAAAAQQGAAPPPPGMDPAMMGGAPPMDPSMMGGAPPMDPAMMGGAPPMDPAMMGGAPPMDPAMMGMDPAMMGMDPAMMGGGMPPEEAGAGTPITLTLEDLQQVIKEITGGGGEEGGKRATNKQIMERLDLVQEQLSALAAGMGVQLPAGQVGAGGDTSTEPTPGEPGDIDAALSALGGGGGEDPLSGNPAFDALGAGLPPGETMPKTAGFDWSKTKLG